MLKTDQPVPRTKTLRPERIAWLIVLSGFAVFCVIAAGAGVFTYRWWTRPQLAPITVEVQQQLAVQVQRAGSVRLEVPTTNELNPGDRLEVIKEATPGAAAKLNFGSASVVLWAGTNIQIGQFGRQLNDPSLATARFNLLNGQLLVDITDNQRIEIDVGSRGKPIVLERGRYRVRLLDPDSPTTAIAERALGRGLEIAVERGQALFGDVTVRPGMLLQEVANKQTPRLTTWQLLRDATFQQLVNDTNPFRRQPSQTPSPWQLSVEATVEGAKKTGQVQAVQNCVDPIAGTDCERPYVRFVRLGGNDKGFSTAIQQQIDADVSSYREVRLAADLKIVDQSLSKAGETGTECPLLARVRYMNNEGQNLQTDYCFWAIDRGTGVISNLPYIKTRQLQQGAWYPLDIDLKKELPNLVKIHEVSFQANGHDYDSQVSNVRLTASGIADLPTP